MIPVSSNVRPEVWFRLASFAEAAGITVEEAAAQKLAESVGWTPRMTRLADRDRAIRRLHSQGLVDEAIGRTLGVSGEQVRLRRHDLGLPNNGKQGRKPRKGQA